MQNTCKTYKSKWDQIGWCHTWFFPCRLPYLGEQCPESCVVHFYHSAHLFGPWEVKQLVGKCGCNRLRSICLIPNIWPQLTIYSVLNIFIIFNIYSAGLKFCYFGTQEKTLLGAAASHWHRDTVIWSGGGVTLAYFSKKTLAVQTCWKLQHQILILRVPYGYGVKVGDRISKKDGLHPRDNPPAWT